MFAVKKRPKTPIPLWHSHRPPAVKLYLVFGSFAIWLAGFRSGEFREAVKERVESEAEFIEEVARLRGWPRMSLADARQLAERREKLRKAGY